MSVQSFPYAKTVNSPAIARTIGSILGTDDVQILSIATRDPEIATPYLWLLIDNQFIGRGRQFRDLLELAQRKAVSRN